MDSKQPRVESFRPEDAKARIQRADALVRAGRRWRSGSLLALAVVTIAYFAVMGGVHYTQSGLVATIMTIFPVIAVIMGMEVFGRRRTVQSRLYQRHEVVLATTFAILCGVAGVLATLLPHPLPAALSGIVPAVPCLIGARRAMR